MSKERGKPSNGRSPAPPAAASGGKTRPPKRQLPDETDTFIAEVSEELQRDRMYDAWKKYGPYAIAAIVVIVAGSALFEYQRSVSAESAREAGGALLNADAAADPAQAFLEVADAQGGGVALMARLRAADARVQAGDVEGALVLYEEIAANGDIDPKFRDLAELKSAMARMDTEDPSAIAAILEPLTSPGAPYRPLALELQASALLQLDQIDAARTALSTAIGEPNAPSGVVERSRRLLDALGGPLSATESLLPIEGDADTADQPTQ